MAENLLNGNHQLNLFRSSFILISMFGLLFIYFTICFISYEWSKSGSILAFLGFFVFFLQEVILRSIELVYIQLQLPEEYLRTADPSARQAILGSFETFQSIQHSLYLPLMISPMIGSIILVYITPTTPLNRMIRGAFAVNAIRLLFRILAEYLGIDILGHKLTAVSYLPLVILIFGLTALWLFRIAGREDIPTAS